MKNLDEIKKFKVFSLENIFMEYRMRTNKTVISWILLEDQEFILLLCDFFFKKEYHKKEKERKKMLQVYSYTYKI